MPADRLDPTTPLPGWPTDPIGPFPAGHPDGPPADLSGYNDDTLPPGTQWGYRDGRRIPVYYDQPVPPLPAAAPQPIPAWAKTTALLMVTGATCTGITAAGLAYAAHSLDAIARGLIALAIIAGCIAAAVITVTASFRRDRGPKQVTHITQNVTATGWLGRAHGGTITKH